MHVQTLRHTVLPLMLMLPLLGGCSLEAAMEACAQCGQIRSISPRAVTNDILLPTDAPVAVSARAGAPVVYDVRVYMDRGGAQDFVLTNRDKLRVGDRVEIREGRLVPVARVVGLGLT